LFFLDNFESFGFGSNSVKSGAFEFPRFLAFTFFLNFESFNFGSNFVKSGASKFPRFLAVIFVFFFNFLTFDLGRLDLLVTPDCSGLSIDLGPLILIKEGISPLGSLLRQDGVNLYPLGFVLSLIVSESLGSVKTNLFLLSSINIISIASFESITIETRFPSLISAFKIESAKGISSNSVMTRRNSRAP
jgi:hypothetical protein